MPGRNLPNVSIPVALLVTELFQRFFSELAIIKKLHGSTLYNIGKLMSREKNPNRKWGPVLQRLREDAGLTQPQLAILMGYPKGKGKISEIEAGKLPITEEKIRKWVEACNQTMPTFYVLATAYEGGTDLVQMVVSPKKSN